jgi:Ca2+-dependent lipid-binding protein
MFSHTVPQPNLIITMTDKDPMFVDPIPLQHQNEQQSNQDAEWWKEIPPMLQPLMRDYISPQYEAISQTIDSFSVMEHVASAGIVCGCMSLTIFFTYWQFSWAWYLVILSLLSRIYATNITRYKRKIRNQAWIEYQRFQMDIDLESVEWCNAFLTRYWPNYEPGLSQGIKETIDVSLDLYKPKALEELRLTTFTLGSQPPRINSIKTFANTDEETLIMDWDISFTPVDSDGMDKKEMLFRDIRNVEFILVAKVGVVPLQVMLKEFYLAGKVSYNDVDAYSYEIHVKLSTHQSG